MDTARAKSELAGGRFERVEWVDETGSTNTDLLERARAGAPEQVLGADHQIAGRGRLGRTWEAPPGTSLLCSILVRPEPDAPDAAGAVTTALGLAAAEACQDVAGVPTRLKWPNDLVVVGAGPDGTDRKVAGILAESVLTGGRVAAVVVGIGVNVNWPDELPEELASIATSLRHHAGHDIDRTLLLVAMLRGFEARLAQVAAHGPLALRDEYLTRSATIGRRVRVDLGGSELVGVATGVDADGALLVDGDDGHRHVVAAGDVVHLRPVGD